MTAVADTTHDTSHVAAEATKHDQLQLQSTGVKACVKLLCTQCSGDCCSRHDIANCTVLQYALSCPAAGCGASPELVNDALVV
jgi:hypothetical protein